MINRKILYAAVAAVIIIVAAVAGWYVLRPTENVSTRATVSVALPAEPENLDMPHTSSTYAMIVASHVVERLVLLDANTSEPKPLLAESWEVSSDGLTYTFHLRQGVKFQDGTPFNASCVAYTINRLQTGPGVSASHANLVKKVNSTEIIDDYTIKFHLLAPYAPLMSNLGHPGTSINSPSAVQKWGETDYRYHIVGTGPFNLSKYLSGVVTELDAFDGYWGGAPKLQKLRFLPIPDASVRELALETGEVDFDYSVPPQDIARLEANAAITVYKKPTVRVQYLHMNCANPPFNDTRVRQAVYYAIDRAALVNDILLGLGQVADAPIGRGCYGYVPSGYDYPGKYNYNVTKARELLAEAGYADGFDTTMITQPGRYLMNTEVMEAIQSYLNAVGIRANIQKLDGATWFAYGSNPDNKYNYGFIEISWGTTTGDPDATLRSTFYSTSSPDISKGLGWSYYKNPQLDALIDSQGTKANVTERFAILKQIYDTLLEDAPCVFLYEISTVMAMKQNLKGVDVYVAGDLISLRSAWME